ncbi:hypothetical protein HZB02_00950 [Candidatus Woesearchaeota archaeon]|nr:hypothetical protein [Candidatus Woesearchaeota archaeon]
MNSMKISKQPLFVLFALMAYLRKANALFADQPLEVAVSKIAFIRLLKETQMVDKSTRGLYHNLEMLEKKKLILYDNKLLQLTEKGLTKAREMEEALSPYLDLLQKISAVKTSGQTHLKVE